MTISYLPPTRTDKPDALSPTVTIIDDQPEYLIIDKPIGLPTHTDTHHDISVVESLRQQGITLAKHAQLSAYDGLVHRLDKETSGLMIIAKTAAAHDYFRKLFAEREINKFYYALVKPQQQTAQQGIIRAPIGRAQHNRRLQSISVDNNARPAESHFWIEERNPDAARVRVQILTGRTHQVRVHLKSIGLPIYGDELYGIKTPTEAQHRLYLHAAELLFTDHNGIEQQYHSPLPQAFDDLQHQLGLSANL